MGTVVPRISTVTVSRITSAAVERWARPAHARQLHVVGVESVPFYEEDLRRRHPVSCPGELPGMGLARVPWAAPSRRNSDGRHGDRQRTLGAGHRPPGRRGRCSLRVVLHARPGRPRMCRRHGSICTVNGPPGDDGHCDDQTRYGHRCHGRDGEASARAFRVGARCRCVGCVVHVDTPTTGMGRAAGVAAGYQRCRTGKRPGRTGQGDSPEQPAAPRSPAGGIHPADEPVRLPEVTGAR
jgi:hypothetical protein